MSLLSKPWALAILALALTLGTQVAAFKLYWEELFPSKQEYLVIKRGEQSPLRWSFAGDSIEEMSSELRRRLLAVEQRETELAAYEAQIDADKVEIDEIKRRVDLMRKNLLADVIKLENTEVENLKKLSKTYSGLDPQATVNIFRELDDTTVVKILFFMKSDIVSAILETMALSGNNELVRRAAKLSDNLRLFTDKSEDDLALN